MGFGSNQSNGRRSGDVSAEMKGDEPVGRMFVELPDAIERGALKELIGECEQIVAAAEREEAPRESGLLRQAIGGSQLRTYGSKLFVAIGVRRGFRKAVQAKARGRGVKIVGRKLQPKEQPEDGSDVRDPVKYLHLVTGGRRAIDAQAGRILHATRGDFFTKAKEAKANPFMDRAFDRAQAAVLNKITEEAPDRILAEASSILKR